MPGIAGIIRKATNRSFDMDLDLMLGCMMHEPFYTSGRYVNDQAGIYAGWVCHKGSFADCMPIWNEKKDSCLLFSGEDFTDRNAIEDLKFRGHEFDSSNASYLIHIYEEKGDGFFGHLNGRISGILLDILNKKIVLFNDRYGMQRIYYHENNDLICFSSEAKSLLKMMPELRSIDYKSFGEFFSCGCALEDRTLFSKIYLLPCGSKWTFRNGCITDKGCYFKASSLENHPELDTNTYYGKLKNTFSRILPRYFRSREQIGMSLTGGLDTRMIMAHIDLQPGQLPCYTFGGMYRDSADVRVARKVANLCRQPYQVIRLEKKFFSDFQELAEKTVFITDGCLDVSGSPELYVNRLAREIAPIRMTGNYGSEVLRSNIALKSNTPCEQLFNANFYKYIQEAGTTLAETSRLHRLSFVLAKQAPWYHYGRFALEQSQLSPRSPFLDNDLVTLAYQAPQDAVRGNDLSIRLINDGDSRLCEIRTDRGIIGEKNHLSSRVAHYYQEFTFKAEYVYDYGMPQWLAKLDHFIQFSHIEKLFLGRHKFYHFRIWYRDELSDFVREILLDQRTINRSYLNRSFLEKMIDAHVKGEANYTTEIHKLLTVEFIHRLFIDSRTSS